MTNHYCKEYDDNCEGCQPAIVDPRTGQKLPESDPVMMVIRAFWKTVPMDQKRACHRVWCHNSRAAADLDAIQKVSQGMEIAMASLGN